MTIKSELPIKILHLVEKSPIHQVDLTKMLNIKHDQRIAEAVKTLMDTHKITRTKVKYGKRQTYLITLNGKKHKKSTFNMMLINNLFSPCTGCNTDCIPHTCQKLDRWLCN